MQNLTLKEKITVLLKSSKDYRGVLLIGILFIIVGLVLAYLGLRFNKVFLIVFGGFFVVFSLFFLGYTIPSSVQYYYDKVLSNKYGKIGQATLVSKEVIDNSYYATKKRKNVVQEINYLITFSYQYQNKSYTNSDFIPQTEFEKLNIGDAIPIKFLTIKPTNATIRTRKLKNELWHLS